MYNFINTLSTCDQIYNDRKIYGEKLPIGSTP